jgi:hypothetical protein
MRFENLKEELSYIGSVINRKITLYNENTHQRPKNKADYRSFYNDTTREIVETIFHKEIEHFEYKF